MNALNRHTFSALILGFMILGSPLALAKEEIVIALQQDPASVDGTEPTCVALQMGIGLLTYKKSTEVTLFASLDGVFIADLATYGDPDDSSDDPVCETMDPETGALGTAPLGAILNRFLNEGGEVLLCPLCFATRVRDDGLIAIEDDRIYAANPMPLLHRAKKVITY